MQRDMEGIGHQKLHAAKRVGWTGPLAKVVGHAVHRRLRPVDRVGDDFSRLLPVLLDDGNIVGR